MREASWCLRRNTGKAALRQTQSGSDGAPRMRGSLRPELESSRPRRPRAYAEKSDLHKEDAACPRNTPRWHGELNQSLAMISDKGTSKLSLSPAGPQKISNRTKTGEFPPMSAALRLQTATIAKQPAH